MGRRGERTSPAAMPSFRWPARLPNCMMTSKARGTTRTRPESARGETTMKLEDKKLFRQQCYVAGAWLDAESGATIEVTNPVDGSVIGTVPKMGARETRRAIERSEEHTSELQSLMRLSYAVFCLQKNTN